MLLTACGGGSSGGSPSVTTYAVSATAGAGGSISPATATVDAGGATTFTVTPNIGYGVFGVTGCGGALSGTSYTTGTITADCAVTATFVRQAAVTVEAAGGGTVSPSSATVNLGSTTTFTVTPDGGHVFDFATGCGATVSGNTLTAGPITGNCLVVVHFSAAFTWMGGSNATGANGIYGVEGVPAAANVPGARDGGITWTDANGNLWLFGGFQIDGSTGTRVEMNDLWKYPTQ